MHFEILTHNEHLSFPPIFCSMQVWLSIHLVLHLVTGENVVDTIESYNAHYEPFMILYWTNYQNIL